MDNETAKFFRIQIDEILGDCVREGRCPYYPCHKTDGELVCLFCYCPFYPCGDSSTGGKTIDGKDGPVWDCSDCGWIHRKDVTRRVLELFYDGCGKNKIFETVRRETLKEKK